MADKVTAETRSKNMAAIRAINTAPEVAVRKALHHRGFRYALHAKKMPGKPDMVFPKYRAVIWINGCFWHGHGCSVGRPSASRIEYWGPKIIRTQARDAAAIAALGKLGWRSLTIWECCLRGRGAPGLEAVADYAAGWLKSGMESKALNPDSFSESLC